MKQKKFNYNGQKVVLKTDEYRNNGTLALVLVYPNGDTEVITTNLNSPFQSKSMAFLDTNNHPGVEKLIRDNDLGRPMYVAQRSGFCIYPLYTIFRDSL